MYMKGGGPTGILVTCFQCHGRKTTGSPECGHEDDRSRRVCHHVLSDTAITYAKRINGTLRCGHKPDKIIPAPPCRLCDGTGYIPYYQGRL